jgi:hypothetical protein
MKQAVYLMVNPLLPFRVKIGISNKVERRERETGAFALFHFRLPYAAWIENGLHAFYRPLHWPASKRWSGHSEYFACLNPMATMCMFIMWPMLPTEYYAIVLFLPLPIDAAVILYCIAAVLYGAILGAIILFGIVAAKLILL